MINLSKIVAYVKAHADHFLISIGVSIIITVITNVLIHYGAIIMQHLHVPAKIINWLTQS